MRNSISDHMSPTWFSTGVPVSAMCQSALSERAARDW